MVRSADADGRRRQSRLTRAAWWGLAAAVVGSALAVGAVHTVTLCVVTATLGVAVFLGWWAAEPLKARSAATVLLLTGLGLTGYTALQSLPIPIGALAAIAPHNADVWSRALSPMHLPGPAWASISLDPGATRVEVLRGVAYLLTFLAAILVARRKNGVIVLSAVVAGTASILGLLAILHPAFGLHRLYGFYEPGPTVATRHLAPLINPNNLAGYLNVGICLSLAAMLAPEARLPRIVAGSTVLLLVGIQIWVASRGGVATMLLGAAIVLAISRGPRGREAAAIKATAVIAAVAVLMGVALFVLSGADDAATELLDRDTSKLKMFQEVAHAIPAMPFFGCGRGAFESAFPAFRAGPGFTTYSHPENLVLQWSLEWGVPAALAGFCAIAVALRPTVMLARSTTAAGAWGAIVAFGAQNMADLGSEIPGVMIAVVVCAAIVVAGTQGREPRHRIERWSLHPRRIAMAAALCTLAALGATSSVLGRELHDDQRLAYEAATGRVTNASTMRTLVGPAMLRHPAEPYLPFAAALRAASHRDESPLPWIGATFERANVYAPAHLLLARLLSARSPSQARLEYRSAVEQSTELTGTVLAEAPALVLSHADALELLPGDADALSFQDGLAEALRERLPSTRVRLDASLLARAPLLVGPELRITADSVEDLEAGAAAPWCAGQARRDCLAQAYERTARLQRIIPERCEGFALHARVRIAAGDAAGGVVELDTASQTVVNRIECLQTLASLARRTGNNAVADAALEKIGTSPCEDDRQCALRFEWVGREFEASGKSFKALSMYNKALEHLDDDGLLQRAAELAASHALHGEAAADYERLSARHPENPEWRARAAQQRDAAMRDAERL